MATICIDFDGTIVEHMNFPEVGPVVPSAKGVIKALHDHGHELILWTMRSGYQNSLNIAKKWLKDNGLDVFKGYNINPGQANWSNSNKQFAHVYIDDAALGCPLVYPGNNRRPYVDWNEVRLWLINQGYLSGQLNLVST